jgi:uncharacterized membrane protein
MGHNRMASRIAIPVLGLVGMGISGYLTYTGWQGVEPVCLSGDDCATVLAGPYARVMGIPLSLLGLVMYAVLTGLGLLLLSKRRSGQGLIPLGIYVVALGGTLYSAYLFYLQLSEIHAFCTWCLASAGVVTTIFLLSLKQLSVQGREGHR